MHKRTYLTNNIALFIALLFHVCGLAGILFSPYKNWFIQNTPLNLLIMAALLVITHPAKNKNFFLFFIIAAVIGFTAETIGIHTSLLFGTYNYGHVLGIKVFNVPLIIGVNWFIIIYCTGITTQQYEMYMIDKIQANGIEISKKMQFYSFLIDAVLIAVFFDWLMEPVAQKLGFWQWQNGEIPAYNYTCWLVVSALLLFIFKKLNNGKRNIFAVHLLIIQLLFFLVLRTFL